MPFLLPPISLQTITHTILSITALGIAALQLPLSLTTQKHTEHSIIHGKYKITIIYHVDMAELFTITPVSILRFVI